MLATLPLTLTPAEHAALDDDMPRAARLESYDVLDFACRVFASEALREAEDALQAVGQIARPLYDEKRRHADALAAMARTFAGYAQGDKP